MWMPTNKIANIYHLTPLITKEKAHRKIACILRFDYINSFSHNIFQILVLLPEMCIRV